MNTKHRGFGHQRRKRTINGVRIEEQEYPDGSTVFIDDKVFDGPFELAVEMVSKTTRGAALGVRVSVRDLAQKVVSDLLNFFSRFRK